MLTRTFNYWGNELLGGTESKITKDENRANVLHLQNIEVVLIHFNVANNGY